jgi:preprotein translocase subunit YajC
MPLVSRAETYFIIAMMILILVVCAVSVYVFIKTYKKEMKERQERDSAKKNSDKEQP